MTELRKKMPLEKAPESPQQLWEFMGTVKNNYSPLYHEQTWKDKVGQEWWDLLSEMFARHSVGGE